jgi:hypothetical protein
MCWYIMGVSSQELVHGSVFKGLAMGFGNASVFTGIDTLWECLQMYNVMGSVFTCIIGVALYAVVCYECVFTGIGTLRD